MQKKKRLKPAIKKSLKLSVAEGSAYSITDGLGNAYISPFAIAMGASNAQVSALTSIPNLVAPFFQLKTAAVMERFKSRKKIVLVNTFLHAFLWLPILLIPFLFFDIGPVLLIILFSLSAIVNLFINPVWMSWMGDLVPDDQRGRYFGNRSVIVGCIGLVVMLLAGFFLDLFSKEQVFIGFAALFILAFVFRLISTYFFKKMYEPKFVMQKKDEFSFIDFVKKMHKNNFGRYTWYLMLINLVVMIASPFVTVYLLRELNLSYTWYTLITLAAAFVSLISLPFWGKWTDKFGNVRIMKITGMLLPVVPALWMVSSSVYYLLAIQIVSGFVWAGFNLSTGNFIFDAVSREKRAICVSYVNILVGIGIFLGATIGGVLTTSVHISFMSVFMLVFLVSAVLRLVVSATFLPWIKEVRVASDKPFWSVFGLKHGNIPHGFHHHMIPAEKKMR